MHRTYVRRRVTLLASALLVVGIATGPVANAVGSHDLEPVSQLTYRVHEGDTLWNIAKATAPGQDPRPIIQAIEDANHISAGDLMPGMTLSIPLG